jgi:hypothetical protein
MGFNSAFKGLTMGANRQMVDGNGGLSKTMKLDRLMSSHGKELKVTENCCH